METVDPQIITTIINGIVAIIVEIISGIFFVKVIRNQHTDTDSSDRDSKGEKKKDRKYLDNSNKVNIKKNKKRKILFASFSVGLSLLALFLAFVRPISQSMVMMITGRGTPPAETVSSELIFNGWYTWPEEVLKAAVDGNTVTLNGKAAMAGFAVTGLNEEAMRGKTVTLEIQAGVSVFDDGRMVKITVNKDDITKQPENVPNLIGKEYVQETAARIIFTLPDNFDGKLGFVFLNADLRNLQITATYR